MHIKSDRIKQSLSIHFSFFNRPTTITFIIGFDIYWIKSFRNLFHKIFSLLYSIIGWEINGFTLLGAEHDNNEGWTWISHQWMAYTNGWLFIKYLKCQQNLENGRNLGKKIENWKKIGEHFGCYGRNLGKIGRFFFKQRKNSWVKSKEVLVKSEDFNLFL